MLITLHQLLSHLCQLSHCITFRFKFPLDPRQLLLIRIDLALIHSIILNNLFTLLDLALQFTIDPHQLLMLSKHLLHRNHVLLTSLPQHLILQNQQLNQLINRRHLLQTNNGHVLHKHSQLLLLSQKRITFKVRVDPVPPILLLISSDLVVIRLVNLLEHLNNDYYIITASQKSSYTYKV